MSEPATASDVREVASAVRDLAEVSAAVGASVGRLEARQPETERLLAEINTKLAPVATYFEALNKEHAATLASAAEAGNRKRATVDEWLAWLTPKRAVTIIAALGALCGFGGPATGLAGRMQTAADAAWTVLTGDETESPPKESQP